MAEPVVMRRRRTGLGHPFGAPYAMGGPPMPLPGLGHLGTILPSLPPIEAGGYFTFDFNLPTFAFDPTDSIPGWLEDAGISYNNSVQQLAGWINPYLRIQGFSIKYYDSATDLANDILSTLAANDSDLSAANIGASVNFQAQPYYPPNYQAPPGLVGNQPPPPGQTQQNQPGQPAQCDWNSMSFGQYLACELGFSSGITAGATGAIALIAIVGVVLLVKK